MVSMTCSNIDSSRSIRGHLLTVHLFFLSIYVFGFIQFIRLYDMKFANSSQHTVWLYIFGSEALCCCFREIQKYEIVLAYLLYIETVVRTNSSLGLESGCSVDHFQEAI